MVKTLDFFQIYYKEDQLKKLYSFAKPIYNQAPTPYFENSVIASLVPMSTSDLISVASWSLKQKRSTFPSNMVLKETSFFELTQERILSTEFDVAILTPRIVEHNMLFMAQHWHGQAWVDSFSLIAKFLSEKLGIEVASELTYSIYGNHFIARNELYRDYVRSCLIPSIQFMEDNAEVFNQDAGYRARKNKPASVEAIEDYEKVSRRRDWPIGVFLLERLFSIWINGKGFHVVNL